MFKRYYSSAFLFCVCLDLGIRVTLTVTHDLRSVPSFSIVKRFQVRLFSFLPYSPMKQSRPRFCLFCGEVFEFDVFNWYVGYSNFQIFCLLAWFLSYVSFKAMFPVHVGCQMYWHEICPWYCLINVSSFCSDIPLLIILVICFFFFLHQSSLEASQFYLSVH